MVATSRKLGGRNQSKQHEVNAVRVFRSWESHGLAILEIEIDGRTVQITLDAKSVQNMAAELLKITSAG
jgi:hypothetical protein